MEFFSHFPLKVSFLAFLTTLMIFPIYGQITTPCTTSMISSVTPCMSFLTNSTSNGTSPTQGCCDSLKALTSGGMGCLCLIVTASVPFNVPINRSLAISLPRACNMAGVPVQCKAVGAPVPAPGPMAFGPNLSPAESPASVVPEPTASALSPESNTSPVLTPPMEGSPSALPGSRPVLTPSAAYIISPSLMLFASGLVALKFY